MEDVSGAGPGTSAVDERKSRDQGKAGQCMRQSMFGAFLVVAQ